MAAASRRGVVHNPAQALCELVAGMHDADGRVALAGFYDRVRLLDVAERAELARLPMDDAFFLAQTGASALWGEAGYTPVERVGGRPTLEVNAMRAGAAGGGIAMIVPEQASAMISMRLVPDQEPEEAYRQLVRHLESHAPPTVRWDARYVAGVPPALCERDSAAVRALASALEKAWGTRPVFQRSGGGIPVVAMLQQLLGVESVLTGLALPDGNLHGPNERLHLPTWLRGAQALVHFLHDLSS